MPNQPPALQIVNGHVHTFTRAHTPARILPWPVRQLARFRLVRRLLSWLARTFDPDRSSVLGRYAQILETSYNRSQADVFELVRGFHPRGTRFIVLPMDMTHMNAGPVASPIAQQHHQLAQLRDAHPDLVIPFAAVDPRHPGIVETTIQLLEQQRFCGIKLYPPTGCHPYDTRLHELYRYANEHRIPVLTRCSPPANVQYRGSPTAAMQKDPEHDDQPLNLDHDRLLTYFARPDAYLPILRNYPQVNVCLAHFGGAGDWASYLQRPWNPTTATGEESWLARIVDLIRSGEYRNLWTDIAYTLFADGATSTCSRSCSATSTSPRTFSSAATSTSSKTPSWKNAAARCASAPCSPKTCSRRSPKTTHAATWARPPRRP
jgi:predicted TIM-barrel fold metal-dependent hydrolase